MTIKEAAELMEYHNKWRKGAPVQMADPNKISKAIDVLVELAKTHC